ncbi:putative aminophospholipid-translocase, variant 3 [Entomophthora muscae]|nr:putative aminophospholipid-translocase, variant 3 [Entomophthora muscae]
MQRNFFRMKNPLLQDIVYQNLEDGSVPGVYDIPLVHQESTSSEALQSDAAPPKEFRTVRIFRLGGKNQKFPPNLFRNQKYSLISFLPVVLYEQFKYFFNLYFLLVALSQFFPYTRIGYLVTYVGPLVFVLLITIGKEAYDDYQRYLRDRVANSQRFTKINPHSSETEDEESSSLFEEIVPSAQIKVGDLIVLSKDQRVPADMVLLWTSDPSGTCFIRTDQLDGETDWKSRVAIGKSQEIGLENLKWLQGSASIEAPHKDIYNFIGTLAIETDGVCNEALNAENTLWANTVLASGKAVGLVIYTGSETRASLNTSHPQTKVGIFDLEINRLSKILCAVTFGMSFLLIALNGFQGSWYIYLFRFLILFSSIIPISLRVNLDFGKTVYSSFIENDPQIPGTLVRTSTIPEELGRIEYLLTDKTGTLTQNDMVMKKIHLGTMSYGIDTMDEVARLFSQSVSEASTSSEAESRASHLPISAGQTQGSQFKSRRDIKHRVYDMIEALGVCHNVTPVLEESGEVTYQASSPDEVAIVKFTASIGLSLATRESQELTLNTATGQTIRYQILHTFPFNSVTKRMGIIVKDKKSGEHIFFLKGADSTMASLIVPSPWLDEECGNMAREGLRTLVVARKRLTQASLHAFEVEYNAAKLTLNDRAEAMQRAICNHLEFDLELLGLTGVEDKLQDQVKNTLEALRNAGLKIWMLTGDKIETATCIAVSSKLVARNQPIHQMYQICNSTAARTEMELVAIQKDCCLVIDGDSLQICLDQLREEFMELAVGLPAVVCCRCTPTQKADITRLIKDYTGRRVCAIGDGGNDVSMILAANVGVGIVGKEGKQASLAADFSIDQFSYLARLLVWHGRNSYKRSSKLSQFVIHRGLIISVMQAVFSAIFYFAPIALYQGMLLVGYSTLYTMGPVCSLVLDQDVEDDIAMMYPELYKDLTKGRSLSYKTFFWWLMISLYQGGVIMLLALYLFDTEFVNIVSISFTSLILNELIMVALSINTW